MNNINLRLGRKGSMLVLQVTDGPAQRIDKEFQNNDRQLKNCILYCMEQANGRDVSTSAYDTDGITPLDKEELNAFSVYFDQYRREAAMVT